ncbi:BA5345 family protein [Thermaerobacillus caldiproteolyticus]|uniref:hypothetical protein n=1 Tax=Thermaerobacillus caldiproteolyticus TaxID=247480 RepID=UPI00188C1852|nr:hypothetical protein [Anoxybacillus caldiproteolyticus]QPA31360.1 hypothetical protein ISX45_18245 [Anoxybacillus caldiproteolyticus]
MNVETKHIIRWGIPGWIYIISLISYFIFSTPELLVSLKTKYGLTILSLSAILAGIGVPVGYLIHQISMLFGFVISHKWDKYFKEEYDLDSKIIGADNGEKIRERYRHLLSRVHELRALKYSNGLSMLTVVAILYLYSNTLAGLIISAINFLFVIIVHVNQKYFEANLKFFIKRTIERH